MVELPPDFCIHYAALLLAQLRPRVVRVQGHQRLQPLPAFQLGQVQLNRAPFAPLPHLDALLEHLHVLPQFGLLLDLPLLPPPVDVLPRLFEDRGLGLGVIEGRKRCRGQGGQRAEVAGLGRLVMLGEELVVGALLTGLALLEGLELVPDEPDDGCIVLARKPSLFSAHRNIIITLNANRSTSAPDVVQVLQPLQVQLVDLVRSQDHHVHQHLRA